MGCSSGERGCDMAGDPLTPTGSRLAAAGWRDRINNRGWLARSSLGLLITGRGNGVGHHDTYHPERTWGEGGNPGMDIHVHQQRLPGIGQRYEFSISDDQSLVVVARHDGGT